MQHAETRTAIASTGSFLSIPSAFPTADEGVKNSFKVEFRLSRSVSGEIQPEFSTNVALIDFGAVNPDSIDASKIIRDCELIIEIASSYPDELRQIIKELQSGSAEGIERGLELTRKIGLTEENAVESGGGFLFTIIVIGGGLLLSSCGGANKEKVTSPAATTTPKPTPPKDAGPDGGRSPD